MMIKHKIRVTKKFTFYAIPLDPTISFHLFTLRGFTTMDTDIVWEIVQDHWTRESTLNQIMGIINTSTKSSSPITEENSSEFINSLTVEHADTKASGGVLTIRFTILTDGPVLLEDPCWYKIHKLLSKISYTSHMNGTGTILEALYCNIC